MRPFLLVLATAVALSASASPCRCEQFPLTVRDSRGATITLNAPPRRIVSLTPGTTEMLFALGAGSRIVGDTTWCDYPPEARSVPKIGDHNPNYERIAAVRPDLVVVDDVAESTAPARLRSLHIPVFTIHPTTFENVEDTLVTLGRVLGNPAAGVAVKAAMQRKLAIAKQIALPLAAHRPRVLVIVGTNPLWVAGSGTFIGEIVALGGGTPLPTPSPGYASLSREWLIAHQPDIILASSTDETALKGDPLLAHMTAVRTGRIADSGGDATVRPGPRLADGLIAIARSLRRLSGK